MERGRETNCISMLRYGINAILIISCRLIRFITLSSPIQSFYMTPLVCSVYDLKLHLVVFLPLGDI